MYFMPSSTAISVNQSPADRQQMSQQQRFSSSYSINLQTMTPPSQTNGIRIFMKYVARKL